MADSLYFHVPQTCCDGPTIFANDVRPGPLPDSYITAYPEVIRKIHAEGCCG
jgi:hypothetical protein